MTRECIFCDNVPPLAPTDDVQQAQPLEIIRSWVTVASSIHQAYLLVVGHFYNPRVAA